MHITILDDVGIPFRSRATGRKQLDMQRKGCAMSSEIAESIDNVFDAIAQRMHPIKFDRLFENSGQTLVERLALSRQAGTNMSRL